MTQHKPQTSALKLSENPDLGRSFATLVLVGKVISDYPVLQGIVNSITQQVWSPKKALQVKEVSRNTFLFSFEDAKDWQRALKGGPWTLNGNHLVLKEWPPGTPLANIDFSTSDFWVHIHGLIPEQMDAKNAECIAAVMGTFLELDLSTDNGVCRNDVMRIKVRLDIQQPLMPGVKNHRPDGSLMWLQMKYERLPRFCMQCGRMGHVKHICSFDGTGWYGEDREPYEANKFGSWMGTDYNPSRIKIPPSDFTHREIEGSFGSARRGRRAPPSPRLVRREWAKGNGKWALFEHRRAARQKPKTDAESSDHGKLFINMLSEQGLRFDAMEKICSFLGMDFTCLSIQPPQSIPPQSNPPAVVHETVPPTLYAPNLHSPASELPANTRASHLSKSSVGPSNASLKSHKRRSGGLALLWRDDVSVTLKSFSISHMDAVVNEDSPNRWRLTVLHLPDQASDHLPLKVDLLGRSDRRRKPFRFEEHWAKDEECALVINAQWDPAPADCSLTVIMENIRKTRVELLKWNKRKHGNIPAAIKRTRTELEAMLEAEPTRTNLDLKKMLHRHLEDLLDREEIIWRQRSRNTWLTEGDRNTAFFHRKANQRRRKNHIEGLVDENGVLQTDQRDMERVCLDYFYSIFSSEVPSIDDVDLTCMDSNRIHMNNALLIAPFSCHEPECGNSHGLHGPGPYNHHGHASPVHYHHG
ncbi:hypothetical protein Tsubulata_026272 [Turnera subulata]|uniref:CCHC-type domain-containing protein n=1 Tax=Turnera subulata TaxID=218843 RepID=A0A9Q0G227_9ROSI|nr:hypothetical protein Tsubulata_026272 [Turnera subulata]